MQKQAQITPSQMRREIGKRAFGKRPTLVSEIGFGQPYGNTLDSSSLQSALALSAEHGISLIDTGHIVGTGVDNKAYNSSDHMAHRITGNTDIQLSASVGKKPGNGSGTVTGFEFSYDGIMQSFAAHCRELGVDRLELLLLDGLGITGHGELTESVVFPIAMSSGYKALEELRHNGNIDAFGLASQDIEVCIAALDFGDWDGFLLNHRYSLLEQWSLNSLLPLCEQRQVSVLAGEPFNSGILRGGNNWNHKPAPDFVIARVRNIEHLCQLHNIPLAAAALQFPLAHPQVSSVLPEMHDPQLFQEVMHWWAVDIPASFWSDLKLAGLLHEEAPVPLNEMADMPLLPGKRNYPGGDNSDHWQTRP